MGASKKLTQLKLTQLKKQHLPSRQPCNMLPILPILAIAGILVFISTHAALSPPKKKQKSPPDLAVALENVIKAARKEEKKEN